MIKRKKIIFICAVLIVGIMINLAGNSFSRSIGTPLYLDTIGSMLASLLGGYVPSMFVAFCTNLFMSIKDSSQMAYGFLNMIIAMLTCFFLRRGFFDKIYKVILLIPVYTLIASTTSAILSWLLEDADHIEILGNLRLEFFDKGLAILLVFVVWMLIPKQKREFLKNGFNEHAYIDHAEDVKRKNRIMSLRTKLIFIVTAALLFIIIVICFTSYFQFKEHMIANHIEQADGLTNLIISNIDAERVDDYIENGFEADGYEEVRNRLYTLRDNYPDVEFLYVYRVLENGVQVVFDLDTEDVKADPPGEILDFDESFLNVVPDLLKGKEIEPMIARDEYGLLLTVYKPLRDSAGKCQCYAAVDFSMYNLGKYNRLFIIKIITIFIGFLFMIYAFGVILIERSVIRPINAMAYCAESFAYRNEGDRENNVERIKKLNIHTGDELENLYLAMLKTTEDSTNYAKNLKRAKSEVEDMKEQVSSISETAYSDALTGVKNKASYDLEKEKQLENIRNGLAEFAIVMIDLNNLKQVNDTYGHRNGDIYIIGACKLICGIYKHAPVFRIGGDEFVVILTGESYAQRDALLSDVYETFSMTYSDMARNPWERFSAAAGMAVYGRDGTNYEEVFNCADDRMYDNKVEMKKRLS